MGSLFHKIAFRVASAVGSPWAFILAAAVVIGWAAAGPFFGFSDSWQLAINSTTTIVTFLMVFLIQASQNRDSRAIQLKLDELIRTTTSARRIFQDLEEADDAELEALEKEFKRVRGDKRK